MYCTSQVPVGSLFIVPYTGGVVGRLPACEVYLNDINVSKQHAKFSYNEDEKSFTIIDLGSRNGTFIHSVICRVSANFESLWSLVFICALKERLSASKEESEEYILAHDSRLQVGGVTMVVHVHCGLETCDGCEPGLVTTNNSTNQTNPSPSVSREDVEVARKRELRKIRKKFGLQQNDAGPEVPAGYQDRAEVRRQKVGVDAVGAKTETASVQVPIAKKNKGFQMLAKMGWTEGKALGKTEDAITEPVKFETVPSLIVFC